MSYSSLLKELDLKRNSYKINIHKFINSFSPQFPDISNLLNESTKKLDLIKNSKDIKVAIVGEFSSGKSTLINVLLEHNLLKASVKVTTAIPTQISYGNSLSLNVSFADGSNYNVNGNKTKELKKKIEGLIGKFEFPISLDDQIKLLTSSQRLQSHINLVKITFPSPILKSGLTFIDTAGIDAIDYNSKDHWNHISKNEIDCAIVVISMVRPMTLVLRRFLEETMSDFNGHRVYILSQSSYIKHNINNNIKEAVELVNSHLNQIDGQQPSSLFMFDAPNSDTLDKNIVKRDPKITVISNNGKSKSSMTGVKLLTNEIICKALNHRFTHIRNEIKSEVIGKFNDINTSNKSKHATAELKLKKLTQNWVDSQFSKIELSLVNELKELEIKVKSLLDCFLKESTSVIETKYFEQDIDYDIMESNFRSSILNEYEPLVKAVTLELQSLFSTWFRFYKENLKQMSGTFERRFSVSLKNFHLKKNKPCLNKIEEYLISQATDRGYLNPKSSSMDDIESIHPKNFTLHKTIDEYINSQFGSIISTYWETKEFKNKDDRKMNRGAGGGGLTGAVLGFFLGGPIGAIVGGLAGGASGLAGGAYATSESSELVAIWRQDSLVLLNQKYKESELLLNDQIKLLDEDFHTVLKKFQLEYVTVALQNQMKQDISSVRKILEYESLSQEAKQGIGKIKNL